MIDEQNGNKVPENQHSTKNVASLNAMVTLNVTRPFLFLLSFVPAGFLFAGVDYQFEKHFTLEEANALIPAVRRLFAHVQAMLVVKPAAESGNGKSRSGNGNGNGSGNGHGDTTPQDRDNPDYSNLTLEERKQAATELLNSISRQGIVIQDFRRGLIDFPSLRDGQEVFLCYELADGNSIQFFHDLDAGYAGREPL